MWLAGHVKPVEPKDADEGPFSEATVKLSWAPEWQGNRLPEPDLGRGRDALSQWAGSSIKKG